jgi:hypothetical protein
MKTFNEIYFQPELWLKAGFLKRLLIRQDLHIILTGAGTSEYVGEALEGSLQCCSGKIIFNKIITLSFNNKK